MEYCIDKIERVLEYGEICGTIGYGGTLADAIRNAGIRCRNCKNWHDPSGEKYNHLPEGWGHCSGITADSEYDGEMISATGSEGIGTIVNTKGDFFCANHSELI